MTRRNLLLAVLAVSAFAVRWYFMRYHVVMVPDYDGAEYISHGARVFSGGRFYTIFIPPGMPVLISLALPFFDDPQTAGMFVSALFGTGLCFATYLLAAELFDDKTAVLAFALTAFFGQLMVSSTWVMSEMPFGFFVFMGLYAGIAFARRPGVKTAFAYGGLFGGAYLIRPEGMVIFVMATAVLALWAWLARTCPLKRFGVGVLLASAVVAALAAPYMSFLNGELGRLSISGKVYYNLAADQDGVRAAHASGPLIYLVEAFGPLAKKYSANFVRLWSELTRNYPAVLLVLAAFGAALSPFLGRRRPMGFFILLVPALFVLSLPLFFIDRRIISPYYPVLLAWAALGATFLEGKLLGIRPLRPAARYAPLSAVLAIALAAHFCTTVRSDFNHPEHRYLDAILQSKYLKTGKWLKGNSSPGDRAFSRELLPVFYSGLEYVNLPDLPPEKLWRAAKDKGVRFVIVDDVCMNKRAELGPLLVPFTDRVYRVPGFACVYNNALAGIVVYRVEDSL